ncbi:MAG: DUF2461 domain-containing protein [Maribacter sp.]|nr:DUF2461 domain-containing protein [Maribacter sp.]MBT8301486.1 DUF2461 domain-containing protein [Maribacter sp.]NNK19224.1 DUF2461 domain-containing protein [Maribacter sp.]
MQNPIITKEVFQFLKELEKNNTREWFTDNKPRFKEIETGIKAFFATLMEHMKQHDDIEKMKMFRIYRDVRFSKDKSPYKLHLAGSYSRAGARLRGGYYVHLKPGGSFIATGFWDPNKEDLLRIRKELELDADAFRKVISDKKFKKIWGDLEGDEVKTAPKGFNKEHSNIDLIKKKQFIFVRKFSDREVLSKDFLGFVDESFRAIRPYFDLMSEILTTNLNGESLLD